MLFRSLAGYALGCEAHHPTAPEPDGQRVSSLIVAALTDSGATIDDVDHINAHGTATPQNDAAEARAFRRAFGERAGTIPVTSIKSMVGHCLGAAGGVEAAVLALRHLGHFMAEVHLGAKGLDLLEQAIDQLLRAADGQRGNVVDRFLGIQLGALAAGMRE